MSVIVLKKIWHRGQDQIAVFFSQDDLGAHQKMKRLGARYSKTHRCWYFVYSRENYYTLKKNFDHIVIEKSEDSNQLQKKENDLNLKTSAPSERKHLSIAQKSELSKSTSNNVGLPRWIYLN